jgi:hypothetical protein
MNIRVFWFAWGIAYYMPDSNRTASIKSKLRIDRGSFRCST